MKREIIIREDGDTWTIDGVPGLTEAPTAADAARAVAESRLKAAEREEAEGRPGIVVDAITWEYTTHIGRMVVKAVAS